MSIKHKYVIPLGIRPDWFQYPPQYIALLENNQTDFTPWHLLEASESMRHHLAMKRIYGRELLPIAYTQNRDDFACLEKGHADRIFIIHDAEPGWEDEAQYPD